MAENKIVKAGMTAEHAHSPAIQVVIGKEIFLEMETGDAMNVFFVNKSFLVEHSPCFAHLSATAFPGNILHLQVPEPLLTPDNTEGIRVFEDWLVALYQGTIDRLNSAPLKDFELSQRLEFVDLVDTPFVVNLVMGYYSGAWYRYLDGGPGGWLAPDAKECFHVHRLRK